MANKSRIYYLHNTDTGEELRVENLREFCRMNNLSYSWMYKVANDPEREKTCQGYRASHKQGVERDSLTYVGNSFALVNDGLEMTTDWTDNKTHLAKQSGISKQSVWRLINGKAVNVRGWRLVRFEDDIPSFGVSIDYEGEEDL